MKDEELVAILRSTWRRRVVTAVVVATIVGAGWVIWRVGAYLELGLFAGSLLGFAALVIVVALVGGATQRVLGIPGARETLLHRAGWRDFEDLVEHQPVRLEDTAPGTWELAVELRALPHGGWHHATVTVPPEGAASRHRTSRAFERDDPDPRAWITQHDTELDDAESDRLRELLADAVVSPLNPKHEPVKDGGPFRLVASTRDAHPAFDFEGNAVSKYTDPRLVELFRLAMGSLAE